MPEPDWPITLIDAARRDLDLRAELERTGALFHGYHAEMEALHLENAALLARAFDALGWPSRPKVGDDAAAAAMLILQHAISRPDLQRRGLALLLDAVAAGEANALDAAYFSDRIAVFEGRPQVFGTQFDWDEEGLLSPAPIADAIHVEDRRASVGLPPLADAIAQIRASAAAEGDGPPTDLSQRKTDFEAWARRVGWRA